MFFFFLFSSDWYPINYVCVPEFESAAKAKERRPATGTRSVFAVYQCNEVDVDRGNPARPTR